MLLKYSFDLLGRHVNLIFRSVQKKNNLQYGIGNRCKDGRYLLFLDYDQTDISWIMQEIKLLQEEFNGMIGAGYIFRTKNGFHVLFLEKLFFQDMVKALNMTSADKQYQQVPLMYGRKIWVLRTSEKKDETMSYMGCISYESKMERSKAHLLFLNAYPPFGWRSQEAIRTGGPLDTSKTVILGYYYVSDHNN